MLGHLIFFEMSSLQSSLGSFEQIHLLFEGIYFIMQQRLLKEARTSLEKWKVTDKNNILFDSLFVLDVVDINYRRVESTDFVNSAQDLNFRDPGDVNIEW